MVKLLGAVTPQYLPTKDNKRFKKLPHSQFVRRMFSQQACIYSRLSLSRNRRDLQKQFEISVLRHIRFVVLRKKQFEQPIFTNDYVI